MKFGPKQIQLKDGRWATLRSPVAEDAAAMLEYLKHTSAETEFVIRYPEECTDTIERESAFLQQTLDSDLNQMIACEIDGIIAGNCTIMFHGRMKTRHRAGVAIAIIQDYWDMGIGSAMFEEMIATARSRGVRQLELEVIQGNSRAMGLYEKFGFRVVAEKPNAIRLKDGTSLSEYIMIRKLEDDHVSD